MRILIMMMTSGIITIKNMHPFVVLSVGCAYHLSFQK